MLTVAGLSNHSGVPYISPRNSLLDIFTASILYAVSTFQCGQSKMLWLTKLGFNNELRSGFTVGARVMQQEIFV